VSCGNGTVLVVDDSSLVRAVLRRRLEDAGWSVLEAVDGAEGAVVALREQPDIVVTDLEMPVMDGNQLTRLLKGDPVSHSIPIVVLTSHREAASRFWSLYTGADAYLVKEAVEDRLLDTVDRLRSAEQRQRPEASELPQGPLEVVARVARHLDQSLLEATLVTRVMTRGVGEATLDATYWATLETVAEVVDARAVAVVVVDELDTSVHCLCPEEPVSLDPQAMAVHLLDAIGESGRDPVHVHVRGSESTVDGDDDLTGLVTYDLPSRGAQICLGVVPRDPGLYRAAGHRLVASVTTHLAMVIDNARLAARLRELSTLDGLTRLLNHRSIFSRLQDEMERARRYRLPLSIILCDVDHFKQVNDRYGHLAGDAVLRQLSEILGDQLRTADAAGRYGGEEFLLIMGNTDLEAAGVAARRLRRAIEETELRVSSGTVIRVTASFGVATLHELEAVRTPEGLVSIADERLYTSKARGRNTVTP
jgi:diguanylate cyclase (GGDEF)-like protein